MENFKVRIPNTEFDLETNKTYRIIGKVDPSSPRGFQERGITKFEHPLNGEDATVVFLANRNLWDTGLYEDSPVYAKDRSVGKENVEKFKKHLIPKLESMFPEGALSPKADNTYWDSYKFPLNQNYTVATNTPEAFLGLWFALIGYTIAPEDMKDYPIYREMRTPYVIIDRKEKSSNQQRLSFEKSKAVGNFINYLEKDKQFIIDVLEYSGFRASEKTDNSILNSQFLNWVENKKNSLQVAKNFNSAIERFSTELGREELETYKTLNKMISEKKVKYERSEYYLGEESLGANIKEAAKRINEDDSLKERLFNLSLNDN